MLRYWIPLMILGYWSNWSTQTVTASVIQQNPTPSSNHIEKWANLAYEYIYSIPCFTLMSQKNCRIFQSTARFDMNIYLAFNHENSTSTEKFRLVLPRKQYSSQKFLNDAILTIDPFPQFTFGHRLFIFAIHRNLGQLECRKRHGDFIGMIGIKIKT